MSTVKNAHHDDEHHRYVADEQPKATQTRANGGMQGNDPLIMVQPLKRSEMQPSYANEIPIPSNQEHGCYGSMIGCFGSCIGAIGTVPCCPCPNPYRRVEQGSVGLVSRFGQFYKSVDPGLVKVNVASESIKTIDVKIQIVAVPRQTVMTKDNVQILVDSVLVWHVTDPYKAAFGVTDVRSALVERAQTTLRSVIGARTLQSIVSEREQIALEIEEVVETVCVKLGVAVESILIKDIIFTQELQNSLSSAAQQKRIGESKVIAARAEVDAARLMREAADILSSPAAIQIRQLEALQQMARQANTKVVFVPMSLASMGTAEANRMLNDGSDNALSQGGIAARTAQLGAIDNM